MHGTRIALAAAVITLAGCGAQDAPAPTAAPPAPTPATATTTTGDVRSGVIASRAIAARGAARVKTVRMDGGPVEPARASHAPKNAAAAHRRELLATLEAHCMRRPKADPRCKDGRVDRRVALAGLESVR